MAALQLRCGNDNVVPRDAEYYSAHFAAGHGAIGIFDNNGVLVGHSLTREADGNSTTFNVLVDPQHRGQRLHTRMIDKWLEDATHKGLQSVSARVRVDNYASLKNFEAAGMSRVAEEPSPDAPEHMTYWLKKSLRPTYIASYACEFRPLVL
jgi:ribosomal protein S18 acetylase RimI-like enzyme